VVVLDEAYYEYLPATHRTDSTTWLARYPNLILVRTFSKIYGLAGLRIGFGLSSPIIAELLNRVRHPFNVNSVALATAISALSDQPYVLLSYNRNRRGLKQLQNGLKRAGIDFIPSSANFVTARIPETKRIHDALLKQGIITRPLGGYGLPDHLRISVGQPAENTRLIQVLIGLVTRHQ
jgi:histidinol-phosphate aminotransferase